MSEIKISELKSCLSHVLSNFPTVSIGIWSAPGIGKSTVIRELAKETGRKLYDLRLSQYDSVDLSGIPSIKDGRTVWNPPFLLPSEDESILFLDEITSASRGTMAASYQLILDRKLGGYEMPAGTWVICAGNLSKHKSIASVLPMALANRMLHYQVEVDLDEFLKYGAAKKMDPKILAFLKLKPNYLLQPPSEYREGEAMASPRTWEFLSSMKVDMAPKEIRSHLAASAVGQGIGFEYVAFLDSLAELPRLKDIEDEPMSAKVPSLPDARVYLMDMLYKHVHPRNINHILKYAYRVSPDLVGFLLDMIRDGKPLLVETEDYRYWHSRLNAVS